MCSSDCSYERMLRPPAEEVPPPGRCRATSGDTLSRRCNQVEGHEGNHTFTPLGVARPFDHFVRCEECYASIMRSPDEHQMRWHLEWHAELAKSIRDAESAHRQRY